MAPNYLVPLGVPFAALAGGAFIVNRQIGNDTRQKVRSTGPDRFTDALENGDGSADLVDRQYLIFTGVLFVYFLTTFIPNPSVLPDLPWGLVGLTGMSGGTYLLNKSVTTNGLSVQSLIPNSEAKAALFACSDETSYPKAARVSSTAACPSRSTESPRRLPR